MTDEQVRQLCRSMTEEERRQWLRRETRQVWLMHVTGWLLLSAVGLFCLLGLFKTLVESGPLAALQAVLVGSALAVFPSVYRSVWHLIRDDR